MSTKTLSKPAAEKLLDIHAAMIARQRRKHASIEEATSAANSPEARIKAGIRAGTKSYSMSEGEIQDKYRSELQDPAWSAAFHPARKFAILADRKSRQL
jgi:hypothetical protein